VRCNSNTKIPDLLERGRSLGADWIATGHYARIDRSGSRPRLLRGIDRAKDQAYFLWGVPADSVDRLLFPIGSLTKTEVRAYARRLELATADKPESQEICFVPTGTYGDFLARRLGPEHAAVSEGRIVRRDGSEIGRHEGYGRYTIGQRRGLGGGFSVPLYVLGVRPERNEVVVGEESELYGHEVALGDLNWLLDPPSPDRLVELQVRHRAAPAPARVVEIGTAFAAFELLVPQRAITPGQSGAVFDGDVLLGGGRIR
jgi:tRNA-specific 2-thiouridylase